MIGSKVASRRIATVLSIVGITAALGVNCGGSRDPIVEKSSGAAGKKNSANSGSAGSPTATGGVVTSAGSTAIAGSVGNAGAPAVDPYSGAAGARIDIKPAWDWNGVVGTGQSLAVGNQPVLSTKPLYDNLMLSREAAIVPPFDSSLPELTMAPLVERKNNDPYPSPYPTNLWGETPHSAMANQLTAMVRYASTSDFVSVHTIVGESGQGISVLMKTATAVPDKSGYAYAATLFEATAITRLAKAAGKTYGIGAIVMTHGETDSGSSSYKAELIKLLADYNADLTAITGQTTKIPMFLSQQFAYPGGAGQRPMANLTQWELGVERPTDFVCTGPKYQYPGHGDRVHLATTGYQQLGEKTGQVYYERIVLGRDWQPLQPIAASRDGRVITVNFHVPVPPLAWETSFSAPTTDWPNGKGFEVRSNDKIIGIESVAIEGDSVKITVASDLPASGVVVGYAMTAGATPMTTASQSVRWGQLRDSDPFIGATTLVPQPNYCVSFEMSVR